MDALETSNDVPPPDQIKKKELLALTNWLIDFNPIKNVLIDVTRGAFARIGHDVGLACLGNFIT